MYRTFLFITALGNTTVIVSLLIAAFIVALILRRRLILTTFFGALVSGTLASFVIKHLIDRQRPYESLIASGPSFPSGHALLSTIVYGFIGYCLWHYGRTKVARSIGVVIAFVIPIFVGISRVYLGVHYVSDVIGGWIIGAVILFSWIFHVRRAEKRDTNKPKNKAVSHLFVFVVIFAEILIIGILLYQFESYAAGLVL